MENLDMKCAELGQQLAAVETVQETILTDTIGVIEEQGLYAAFLFLKAHKKDGGQAVSSRVEAFLKKTPNESPLVGTQGDGGNSDVLESIKTLSLDLDDLLLAHDLVRHALVYARYHIKAKSR